MIVYCNGDSFVAGTELADYMLPEYPGCLPFNASETLRQKNREWIGKTYTKSHEWSTVRHSHRHFIEDEERARAWPTKLHNLLGCEVINAALGGSSMDRIARSTVTDLISLQKENDSIVAVIGTTGMDRYEVAHDSQPWVDIIPHYSTHSNTEEIINYKLKYEKDYHVFVNFYRNVIFVKDFCEVNNIKLIWLSAASDEASRLTIEEQYKNEKDLLNLKEYAQLKYSIDMFDIASTCGLANVFAPSHHFSEEVHAIVANQLQTIIRA